VVRALLEWYRVTEGSPAYARVFDGLTPADRAELGGDAQEILASAWYDARIVHKVLENVFGDLDEAKRRTFARDAARQGMRPLRTGIYHFVAQQILSPRLYARHVQWLFRLLHDTGERRIEMGDHQALSITGNWAGHHPILCLLVQETTAALFETLGCKDVTVEPLRCVADGHRDCRCTLRWTGE